MPLYHPDPIAAETITEWYFAPLLPWQQARWDYFTQTFPNLPHAMLFAGNAGTGKRAFVYRLVAWLLCHNKTPTGACGQCDSCQWLKSGTHPNLYQIPTPIFPDGETPKKTASKKTPSKTSTLSDTTPNHASTHSIKIDDIRDIQPFAQQSSEGVRVIVIHQSDSMTLGASNALLKTLEEPAQNVLLILLSDTPSQLLPTVRSRLQQFNVSQISTDVGLDFLQHLSQQMAGEKMPTAEQLRQVLAISGNAPFVAMDMLTSPWYQHRQLWVNSWQAIRSGSRQPTQASDFWQSPQSGLTLNDFLYLSQMMLAELGNVISGLPPTQSDIVWQKLTPMPSLLTVYTLQQVIEQIWLDRRQHIGEKLCYDKLMYAFAQH